MYDIKAEAIKNCSSFEELENAVEEHVPIVSINLLEEVVWSKKDILFRIDMIKAGYPINYITRAAGLRDKVRELMDNLSL